MATTSSTPLISVALCTYNGERYLREQLDSVLAQREVNLEVVALDDGSSDGTLALLRDYAAREPRLRVSSNPSNLGHMRSFERAMSLCRGEFIAPCDQDDVWEPDKLKTLLAAIGTHDLAYCDSAYIDHDGRPLARQVSGEVRMMSGGEPLRFLFANTVSGHASLVRRQLVVAATPFPDGVFHDWWLAMCAAAGNGVTYVDQPLVRFRRHAAACSNMGQRRTPSRDEWLDARRNLLAGLAHQGTVGSDEARAVSQALEQALDGRSSAALMAALWHVRGSAPRTSGWPPLDVLVLQLKFLRKVRRRRRERAEQA